MGGFTAVYRNMKLSSAVMALGAAALRNVQETPDLL